MKKISLLGSTGSIGRQSLDIIRENPSDFQITALACGRNIELLKRQIEEFKPERVCVATEEDASLLKKQYCGTNIDFSWGDEGLKSLASQGNHSLTINALVGIKGLESTYETIKSGKDVALANKESLVTGGSLVMKLLDNCDAKLIPVDSEHSAIFQSLGNNRHRDIKNLILTASGGPFRNYCREELKNVTVKETLAHPNWNMGQKITVDSATLMNKGLELIEARWLFNISVSKIKVVVHPQSILHSGVEFVDGGIVAQLGKPDMRLPIAYALTYPDRLYISDNELDLFSMKDLTFEKPNMKTFKPLKLAYDVMEAEESYSVVLNSVNEVLVERFLKGKIGFLDIGDGLEDALNRHKPCKIKEISDILEIDKEIRMGNF